MDISDKVVLVTGGASGIGEAMARRFAADGAGAVIVTDIAGDAARRVADAIGGEAMELDVADEQATEALIGLVEDEYGRIDLLCLNAGIATSGSVDAPIDLWQRTWEVNLMSHVYATKFALPAMLERGSGYILTTASAAGLLTSLGSAPYSVTKHAAVALAEWLAVTYGTRGIGVSCLCPQFVETPLLDVYDDLDPALAEWVRSEAITPDQVADAVAEGLADERFLILPHSEVLSYFQNKADNYDRWIGGMRKLQSSLVPGT